MNKKMFGFTLLELLFSTAIIGILAAVAIPSYSNYLKRAIVSEGLVLTSKLQVMVVDYYAYRGKLPVDNMALNWVDSPNGAGKYVQNLYVENGAIHIVFSQKIGSPTLTLRPSLVQEPAPQIIWTCGYRHPLETAQVFGQNKTNIKREYLPLACL
jgi:type IV pilus assembly protein PilA